MDLVPLAGLLAGHGQGHDVPGETGGDDDQPSQLYSAHCKSWKVPRITGFSGHNLSKARSTVKL